MIPDVGLLLDEIGGPRDDESESPYQQLEKRGRERDEDDDCRGNCYGKQVGADQPRGRSVELKVPIADGGTRNEETYLPDEEYGIVEAERHARQQRSGQEQFDELFYAAAKRETNGAPGSPAQAVTVRGDHRDAGQGEHQQQREQTRQHVNPGGERGRIPQQIQNEQGQAENHQPLEKAFEEFRARSVIDEPVVGEGRLAEKIGADPRLPPEIIPPERDEGQKDVANENAEEGPRGAGETQPIRARGCFLGHCARSPILQVGVSRKTRSRLRTTWPRPAGGVRQTPRR